MRDINVWLPLTRPLLETSHNPSMCLDWESNQQPFGSQASTQSTEPHQPGQIYLKLLNLHESVLSLARFCLLELEVSVAI